MLRSLVPACIFLLGGGLVVAEEVAPAPAAEVTPVASVAPVVEVAPPAPAGDPAPEAPAVPEAAAVVPPPPVVAGLPPTPEGWSWSGKVGAWFSSTSSSNSDTSLDPAISTTSDAMNYRLGGDVNALWKRGINEVEQNLITAYGRQKQAGEGWATSTDNALYNGIYRTVWSAPQFTYAGWGAESVFVGPAPEQDAFGEGRAWGSAGYGVKGPHILVVEDSGEARIGVRTQGRWGPNFTTQQQELQTGPEAFGRYDLKLKVDTKAFVQYEAFGDFEDMSHISNLITAGLFMQVSRYLTVDLALRAYYESRPDNAPKDATGYSQWSARSETLIGAVYAF